MTLNMRLNKKFIEFDIPIQFQIMDYGDYIADYGGHEWPKEIVINKKRLAVLEKCRLPGGTFKVRCVLESFGFNPEAVIVKIGVIDINRDGSLELKEGQVITLYRDMDWCYKHQDIYGGYPDTYFLKIHFED